MKKIKKPLVVVSVIFLLALIFVFSGMYDFGADKPHNKFTIFIIEMVRKKSIQIKSKGVDERIFGKLNVNSGAIKKYSTLCQPCHGGPGYDSQNFAHGLYPPAPSMAKEDVQKLSNAELFWVIKHGIKMTGMPSFGNILSDKEIVSVIGLIRRIPEMEVKDYDKLLNEK